LKHPWICVCICFKFSLSLKRLVLWAFIISNNEDSLISWFHAHFFQPETVCQATLALLFLWLKPWVYFEYTGKGKLKKNWKCVLLSINLICILCMLNWYSAVHISSFFVFFCSINFWFVFWMKNMYDMHDAIITFK
jgi:hypothetical protein